MSIAEYRTTWTFRFMAEREMLALACLWQRSDRVAARERIDEHIKSFNIVACSIAVRALPDTTWSTEELHSFENQDIVVEAKFALSCLWERSDRDAARENIEVNIMISSISPHGIVVRALPHTKQST